MASSSSSSSSSRTHTDTPTHRLTHAHCPPPQMHATISSYLPFYGFCFGNFAGFVMRTIFGQWVGWTQHPPFQHSAAFSTIEAVRCTSVNFTPHNSTRRMPYDYMCVCMLRQAIFSHANSIHIPPTAPVCPSAIQPCHNTHTYVARQPG